MNVFEEPLASFFEGRRAAARAKRRIVYDCENARVIEGMRVICGQGRVLAPRNLVNGSMPLDSVLDGRGASECQECLCYACNINEKEEEFDTTEPVLADLHAVCRS